MLIQSEIVNGSSINKTWELKSGARVMNVIGVNRYNFAYSTTWLRSYVNETPPIPMSAFYK